MAEIRTVNLSRIQVLGSESDGSSFAECMQALTEYLIDRGEEWTVLDLRWTSGFRNVPDKVEFIFDDWGNQ